RLGHGRAAWIQVAAGTIDVNGTKLEKGDGAAIEQEESLAITAGEDAEILLFDLR
ncbi:MAG TPA: pirin family protein, partial [Thermoanaerobaculia bacterium]|nr:pirin family protein [Thermoanaerobaculia bacterium]